MAKKIETINVKPTQDGTGYFGQLQGVNGEIMWTSESSKRSSTVVNRMKRVKEATARAEIVVVKD